MSPSDGRLHWMLEGIIHRGWVRGCCHQARERIIGIWCFVVTSAEARNMVFYSTSGLASASKSFSGTALFATAAWSSLTWSCPRSFQLPAFKTSYCHQALLFDSFLIPAPS
ncbi:hypothetical protein GALMADRAFT_1127220 [Galerina marginata CBS 339.88]|uniref:Uncharacterized protein n=1 Tax=Galerina marginata (strain CBS 339.88) TaxID=685588 RepID=A0A067SKH5_GALM3|nr:hypothetical protein GALMADRAFT_1127220 [Galerina marginata CBS 339.88]